MAAEAGEYRKIFERKGLKVSEEKTTIATLDGRRIGYHIVSGYREGSYKVSVRLEPNPTSVSVVISASSGEKAQNAASQLEDAGFTVEVDGERVHATKRPASISAAVKAVEIAEKATGRKR